MRLLRRKLTRWLLPNAALVIGLVVLVGGASLVTGRAFNLGSYTSVQFVLNTNAAALASTLGILMAIVLLMVQLTAQRYSFNIIGMFVQNPRNVALVAFFILTICFNLWLAASLDDGYIPSAGTYLAMTMGTVCFGLLIPYLAFLFDTLTPRHLLDALQNETINAIKRAQHVRDLERVRRRAAERVQHTGDITRTAISLSDADVARHSVWALYGTFCTYLAAKPSLPPGWFVADDRYFRAHHQLSPREVGENNTWFERRVLEEYQTAFTSSLNRLEQVNTMVSLCCRLVGEEALERDDEAVLRLLVRFFNTYLRAALNARDARAGYHLLYQYQLLADAALERRPEIALEIAERITYYGETALGMGVIWMSIAAAQDLRTLAEVAFQRGSPPATIQQLQSNLVRLVRLAAERQPVAGGLLRKAALALGGFHLDRGNEALARSLARDLSVLSEAPLEQYVRELEAVVEPQFWELTDRVLNFEFVEPGARAQLRRFLALVELEAAEARSDAEPRFTLSAASSDA